MYMQKSEILRHQLWHGRIKTIYSVLLIKNCLIKIKSIGFYFYVLIFKYGTVWLLLRCAFLINFGILQQIVFICHADSSQ